MDNLPMVSRRALRIFDRARAPKYLRPDQIKAIIDYEHNRKKGSRLNKYYVLFSMLWNTGARISEVLALKREDVKDFEHQIYFRTLKKQREASRYIPINDAMYSVLSTYINENEMVSSSPLFDLTKVAVHKELKNVCKTVGLPSWVHTHTFRHSFAINCLNCGMHINSLKDILGHESIETTMVYLKVFQPEIREQLAKVQF